MGQHNWNKEERLPMIEIRPLIARKQKEKEMGLKAILNTIGQRRKSSSRKRRYETVSTEHTLIIKNHLKAIDEMTLYRDWELAERPPSKTKRIVEEINPEGHHAKIRIREDREGRIEPWAFEDYK